MRYLIFLTLFMMALPSFGEGTRTRSTTELASPIEYCEKEAKSYHLRKLKIFKARLMKLNQRPQFRRVSSNNVMAHMLCLAGCPTSDPEDPCVQRCNRSHGGEDPTQEALQAF